MRPQSAYTLIELIMVLVIIAIIAGVSFVSITSYKAQNFNVAAERIAADLRYAKNLALASAKWHGVSFAVAPANNYSIYETDGTTDSIIKQPVDPKKNFVINLADEYEGITLSQVNIGGGDKVEFSPHGVPYTDKNGSALSSAAVITLASNGSTLTIRIAANTGRIYIQ